MLEVKQKDSSMMRLRKAGERDRASALSITKYNASRRWVSRATLVWYFFSLGVPLKACQEGACHGLKLLVYEALSY